MKIIATIIVLLSVFSNIFSFNIDTNPDIASLKDGRFVTSAVISQLFEMLRGVVKNGNPEKAIPILDPYLFDYNHLDLPGKLFSLTANIFKGNFSGLGDFEIQKSEFTKHEISLDLEVNFPVVNLHADYYEMEGSILEAFPIAGKGELQIAMNKFDITGKIYLKQSFDGKSILLDRVENAKFKIASIVSETEFDKNIDEIFNTMIEELLADYLTYGNQLLSEKYGETVINILNPFLKKFESWRILAAIL